MAVFYDPKDELDLGRVKRVPMAEKLVCEEDLKEDSSSEKLAPRTRHFEH